MRVRRRQRHNAHRRGVGEQRLDRRSGPVVGNVLDLDAGAQLQELCRQMRRRAWPGLMTLSLPLSALALAMRPAIEVTLEDGGTRITLATSRAR